jgi:hypothetical protein
VAIWDGLLTPDERHVFDAFTRPRPLGKRPAVLVVAHWADRARADDGLDLLSPDEREHRGIGNRIVDEIAPRAGDVVAAALA